MRFYDDPKPRAEMDEEEAYSFLANCYQNFHYFAEVILGYHDMNEEHRNVCQFLQFDKHQKLMFLLPRLTFKSSLLTQGYCLWRMLKDPNIRILIYSDATPKAQGFLRGVKNHIEGRAGRSLWFSHIGKDWKGDITWNENQATVSRRNFGAVEPTIDTSGIDSSKVGMHYDLVIFDDIVSDINVTNKQMMDKTYDCYKKSLSLLKRSGQVVVVGTRWHFGDMYGRLIGENEETDEFGLYVRSALERRKDGGLLFDNIGEESLTQEHLDRLKAAQGTYTFSCLYLNSPVDSEEALFQSNNFRFYGRLEVSPNPGETGMYEYLYTTCTIDPAGTGGDRTGGVVVGTDENMKMYIVDVLNKHLMPHQIVEWVIEMNFKYRLRRVGIETKFYRGMLKRELEKRIKAEQDKNPQFNNFGIDEFSPSRGDNKYIRIQALQPWHERGEILFPGRSIYTLKGGFSDLVHQMVQVTPTHMPEPNDVLDALAFQIPLLQKGGAAKIDQIPENSPADLERKWVREFNKAQRRIPRRMRQKWKTWLS